jgi:V/A-type H+-transporting ATPase subunit I
MIVKMNKIFVAGRAKDRDELLHTLAELGMVHIQPVDPDKAIADEKTVADLEQLRMALQTLSQCSAEGSPPDLSPVEAAQETLRIQRDSAELTNRLSALHREYEQLNLWGNVTLQDLDRLKQANIKLSFYSIATDQISEVQAECIDVLGALPGKRSLVAIIDRTGNEKLPEQAEPLSLPKHDRPMLRAEAVSIDHTLKKNRQRLAELAHLVDAMQQKINELQQKAEFTIAARAALTDENLFALKGWSPADKSETFTTSLAEGGIAAAVQIAPPLPDEAPPTLIRYPKWVLPIKGLFDILGTIPGYKEPDLSPFFMIALPIFAAMLIGDAGYGLIFALIPLIKYRKLVAKAGKEKTLLLLTVGIATMVWGILTANYFGITPDSFAGSGSGGAIRKTMIALAPLWNADAEKAQAILIKISLLFGCIHLTFAHLRQALMFTPDLRALAQVGWCLFLWAMLGIIWLLFFGSEALPVPMILIYLAGGLGAALFVLFTAPSKNPVKMVGVGFASSLLPMLSTFSDTMSYIRLMAVGMASYYIAVAFNTLGGIVAEAATWFAGAPIVIFGHALNIGLCVIAIFAHGVRLNMLEFSNNAGVQWLGYAYAPFGKRNK